MEMTGRSVGQDYGFGFNGEPDDKWNGNVGTYSDFGARMYDNRLGRWQTTDPKGDYYPGWSPYNFVRGNPILRVDPTGEWDVEVHVFNDRAKYGYGIAIVKDRHGKEVYRFKVRVEGSGKNKRNRTITNADTPLGVYDIPTGSDTWISGGSRKSYGPNARLALNGKSGEIAESGRSEIRIHGGRQEVYDKKAKTWSASDSPELVVTHGCLRAFDSEINRMKEITDKLEKDDKIEEGGDLTITDDLVEKADGTYGLPDKDHPYAEFWNYFIRYSRNLKLSLEPGHPKNWYDFFKSQAEAFRQKAQKALNTAQSQTDNGDSGPSNNTNNNTSNGGNTNGGCD